MKHAQNGKRAHRRTTCGHVAMQVSGRCESAYLFVDLYVVNGGGDRQLSRAVRIEGRAKRRVWIPTDLVGIHTLGRAECSVRALSRWRPGSAAAESGRREDEQDKRLGADRRRGASGPLWAHGFLIAVLVLSLGGPLARVRRATGSSRQMRLPGLPGGLVGPSAPGRRTSVSAPVVITERGSVAKGERFGWLGKRVVWSVSGP